MLHELTIETHLNYCKDIMTYSMAITIINLFERDFTLSDVACELNELYSGIMINPLDQHDALNFYNAAKQYLKQNND